MGKKECGFIIIAYVLITIILTGVMTISVLYNANDNNNILNENGATLAIFVDNNEVSSLNDVPTGYVIDEEQSFCYKSVKTTPDTGAIFYSNAYKEHIIGNLVKNERCVLHFEFGKRYWHSNSYYGPGYEPTTAYTIGPNTGHKVYIGYIRGFENFACANLNGRELCLNQPYTQYGLSGHTLNSNLTTAQQTSSKNALYQFFVDEGINITISNCSSDSTGAICYVGDVGCGVYKNGHVYCIDDDELVSCDVMDDGYGMCG